VTRLCFVADAGDIDSIMKTVVSAGTVPLADGVAQRAQSQLLPLGASGGGGGGRRGIGNYGSGGFGGTAGSSAASAMDVEQVPGPSGGGGGGGGGRWAEHAANLVAMGFDREAVTAVLEATQGSVEQAIAILTS